MARDFQGFGRPSCGARGSAPKAGDAKWTLALASILVIFLSVIAYIGPH